MKERVPKPEEAGRMPEDKAHDEANMLRAMKRISPYGSGGFYEKDRLFPEFESHYKRTTKEDYEAAERELDELKRLAEKDPELLVKLVQYAKISAVAAVLPFKVLGLAWDDLQEEESDYDTAYGHYIGGITEFLKKHKERIFSDAHSRLERVKKEAEQFGPKEADWEEAGKADH